MNLTTIPFWFYLTLAGSLLVLLVLTFISLSLHRRRNKTIPPLLKPAAQPEPPPETIEPEPIAAFAIVRRALKLVAAERLPLPDYHRLTDRTKARLPELRERYLPFFIWQGGHITRLATHHRPEEDLDALLDYWQAGYRHPEFALLLACYSEATEKPNLQRFLLQTAAYKKISTDELSWLHFLFQDRLYLHKTPAEMTPIGNSALDFSLKIALQTPLVNRREYKKICLSRLTPDSSEFLSALQAAATLPLALELYRRENVATHIPQLLFKQFLKSGRLHQVDLWLNGSLYPALKLPTNRQETEELTHELLRHSREGRLLALVILRYAHSSRELLDVLEPDNSEVNRLQNIKDTLPDALRQAAFLSLSEAGFHAAAEEFLPRSIPGRSLLAVRLHRARNWYRLGKYREAHQLIEELLKDYPNHLPVLNEAAIYNFRLGNIERTEELFERLKNLFPDNPSVLHNEALFFEQKSLGEIKQRWEQAETQKKPA